MSWESFYLGCFLVGFFFSLISFLAGFHHGHLPLARGFGGHAHAGAGARGPGRSLNSPVNFGTIAAFLAWFGGTGYIMATYSKLVALISLTIASVAGLFAGWVMFRFMARLLKDNGGEMNDWDYRHEGSLGKVSISSREGETGEVIFEQHGIRRSLGARSEDGSTIDKGTEVVISRYEKGIAYVKPWAEFTNV